MSSTQGPSILRQAWYKWKTLRLPWRKQFLVGADLAGNTFWVFKDALQSNRWRRIVRYSPRAHYGDVKITPQWHQWLRHTREEAPSIQEQQYDVSRQAMMKQLAAKADERWKALPSYSDGPALQQAPPATELKDPGGYAPQIESEGNEGVTSGVEDAGKVQAVSEGVASKEVDEGRFKGATKEKPREEKAAAPWQQPARGVPGEDWKPKEWTPGAARRG